MSTPSIDYLASHSHFRGGSPSMAQARIGASRSVDEDALVRRHANLVRSIAYQLAGRLPPQVEVDDLVQSGMIGLLEAAAHFQLGHGASFETYAGIRVRGAMLDALRKLDWAPRSVHRKARAAAAAMRLVEARTGREATGAAVAEQLGIPVTEYFAIVRDTLGCQMVRLNDSEDIEGDKVDWLVDQGPGPHDEALKDARRAALGEVIDLLPERERLVLSLYYEKDLNLREIGVALKVTESRACQLHGQALHRLKDLLNDWRA